MFEAGALSKSLDSAHVVPLLFGGIEPTGIQGPLEQFQAAKFSKEDMKRTVSVVNSGLGENALKPDVYERVFDMWWPSLIKDVESALSIAIQPSVDPTRSERDLLEEILSRVRASSRLWSSDISGGVA